MQIIPLSSLDLSIAALLVIALSMLSFRMKLGIGRQVLVAGLRTTIQLFLVGLVLKVLFENVKIFWLFFVAMVMLAAAGREAVSRQKRMFAGWWGVGVGTVSMFISSFSITIIALTVVIDLTPWYQPQYAIPLLGMMLGNTMNGISISLDRLTQNAWDNKSVIEARLMLGQEWTKAINEVRRDSVRSGMIPIVNAMTAAGLVSLPGTMTGQILAGAPPLEAVKYQILIMFLITGGTGFGTMFAVFMGSRRLFDGRQRLRLDRLKKTGSLDT